MIHNSTTRREKGPGSAPGTAEIVLRWVLVCAVSLPLAVAPAPSRAAAPAAPQRPQAVIDACVPITEDTTWTSGNVYHAADCQVHVPAGVTLTVQPGVVVKLGSVSPSYSWPQGSAAFIVDGTLDVQGTASQPVALTSLKDDAHGGNTNGDGASSGGPGDWWGLTFRSGSVGRLDHVFVGYGGSGAFNFTVGYSRAQVDVDDADVELRHGEVVSGTEKGIYLEGEGITPVIASVHVADNVAADGRGYAIYQDTINMEPSYTDLTFSGNDRDEVTIGRFGDPMTQDATLGGTSYGFACGYTLCLLTVPTGITLTVEPGTLLDFRPSYGIAVADGGSLMAEGTATQPITFTSRLAAAGTPNQHWMGLWAQQGSTLRLDHCDVSYADDGNYGDGGLEINTDDARVSNCHIHHNKRTGLTIRSRDGSAIHPTLTDVDVTDNGQVGLHLATSYGSATSVTWDGGSSSRNGWSGVSGDTWVSSIYPTLKNLAISENGSLGDNDGRRRGIDLANHNMHPLLENVILNDNAGTAMVWYGNGSITARGLTATGNGADELELLGCSVGAGRRWDLGDAGIPVRVTGHVEIPTGGLLSLAPGTTLRFDRNWAGWPTYLKVRDQAALYALGTAEKPVVLTGATETPGWWNGIDAAYDAASLVLRHCEIAYGGSKDVGGIHVAQLYVHGNSAASPSPVLVQNCEIHHSASRGVHLDQVWTQPPVFRDNNLHDNADEGVTNWNAPELDARYNWWGDESGPYHATKNADGLGETVGDNVLFEPWLTAPPTGGSGLGEMLVTTGAPSQVSPGEMADVSIQVLNLMTTTVENAVLVLQLPPAAQYLGSTGGGLYWRERPQAFWKLGDLPQDAQAFVSVQVRYAWGLAADYQDGTITRLAGSNYRSDSLDVDSYLAFPGSATIETWTSLDQGTFDALLAGSADLQTLYDQSLQAGYVEQQLLQAAMTSGAEVYGALLTVPGESGFRFVGISGDTALVVSGERGVVSIFDTQGGITVTQATGQKTYWGSWDPAGGGASAASPGACDPDRCYKNCRRVKLGINTVGDLVLAGGTWWFFGVTPAGVVAAGGYAFYYFYELNQCKKDCANPYSWCCDVGDVWWSPLPGNRCARYKCGLLNVFNPKPDIIKSCEKPLVGEGGQRCATGLNADGGCKDCGSSAQGQALAWSGAADASGSIAPCAAADGPGTSCNVVSLRQAKDPNAIYGPAGDLLPGATVAYTITYENEGAGRAYGVYVLNELPEAFDEATLDLHGAGQYLESTRQIFWLVGELGPKGDPDAEGVITYTVTLKDGLPSGTVVSNQAVVHFPSVPEETPTNTWVNVISPLAAVPQTLTTGYMTPLPITLSGREVSGLPLSYEIMEGPRGGTLSGTAPSLVYTPLENVTGGDGFTFRVSNGITTSRAAQVLIEVTPAGDTTPPQVTYTDPAADASDVPAPASPLFSDDDGPAYAPVVLIGVSEPLSPTTVSSATVTLTRSGGGPVPSSARFDPASHQIVLAPRARLRSGEHQAAVTTAVTDRAGNPLPTAHTWRFTVVAASAAWSVYLPLVLK